MKRPSLKDRKTIASRRRAVRSYKKESGKKGKLSTAERNAAYERDMRERATGSRDFPHHKPQRRVRSK